MAQPWFKFFAGDFLADPDLALLTFEQRGMLIHLWAYAWRGGSLPADEGSLAALLGMTPRAFRGHAPKLLQFFRPHPEDAARIVSPRMELERAESEAKGAKARESASARWSKRNAKAMRTHCAEPCERDAKPMLSESESEKESPLPPQGASPAAPRGRAKFPEAGKLWPVGWSPEAEEHLQHLLAEYPKQRPDGTRMSNGSPKELRRLWLAILQANPTVTPRLLKLCAFEHLESEHHPGTRLEETAFVQLLSTLYGPKKASWEGYLEGAKARQRAQDSGLNPNPIPLMRLQEVAHG